MRQKWHKTRFSERLCHFSAHLKNTNMGQTRKKDPIWEMEAFLSGRKAVEPRRRPQHQESRIQQSCVRWFRLQYPKLALNLFAVGNGGARGKTEAAIMKGEGVTAGVADLLLLAPSASGEFHGLCIEMKTTQKGSRQSDSQKVWQAAVEAEGYKYVVCRSIEEFMAAVTGYIPPPSGRCW